MLTDAEIAGYMGWRGPGAYTEHKMRKVKAAIAEAVARECEAKPALLDCNVGMLDDGFYFFKDPRHPDYFGIIHRLDGETWRIGEGEPFPDDDWVDGVSFLPIPVPACGCPG